MPEVFFLSYARPRRRDGKAEEFPDRYGRTVLNFFADLEECVRPQLPRVSSETHGFLDVPDVPPGSPNFDVTLASAMRERPIGVVLLCPEYVSAIRKHCFWEFDFLSQRNLDADRVAKEGGVDAPRLLFVLNLVEINQNDMPRNYPAELQQFPITPEDQGEGDSRHQTRGLETLFYLWKAKASSLSAQRAWDSTIDHLGGEIVKQYHRWCEQKFRRLWADKGSVKQPRPFGETGAWEITTNTILKDAGAPRRALRKKEACVVYLAAKPHEVPSERAWRYQANGGKDWKPFANKETDSSSSSDIDQERNECSDDVASVVRSVALEIKDDLHINEVSTFSFCSQPEHLSEVTGGALTVIVVDPWTALNVNSYKEALCKYGEQIVQNPRFGPAIVVWNVTDPDYDRICQEFGADVDPYLQGHTDSVREWSELCEAVWTHIMRLHRNVRRIETGKLPPSGSKLPLLKPKL